MEQEPTRWRQRVYDGLLWLQEAAHSKASIARVAARGALRVARGPRRRVLGDHLVRARLYGRSFVLPADHPLPGYFAFAPRFGRPLADLALALAGPRLRVVDVGANIGDTVAIVEQAVTGPHDYLCIEPDPRFADLLECNLAGTIGITIERCFLSDVPGEALVPHHHHPGTASPRAAPGGIATPTRTLDDVALPFAERAGGVDIVKIDTDGYDFKVLRSGRDLLRRHAPALLFEWHPALWDAAGEDPIAVFPFLEDAGYRDIVLFTNVGDFEARLVLPAPGALAACLARSRARRDVDDLHFDVVAAPADVCDEVARRSAAHLQRDPRPAA